MDLDLNLPADGRHLLFVGPPGSGKTQALLEIAEVTNLRNTFILGDMTLEYLGARQKMLRMTMPNTCLFGRNTFAAAVANRQPLLLVDGFLPKEQRDHTELELLHLLAEAVKDERGFGPRIVATLTVGRHGHIPTLTSPMLPGWEIRQIPKGWGSEAMKKRRPILNAL